VTFLAFIMAATPWMTQTAEARALNRSRIELLDLDERMIEVSSGFLGTPYAEGPLGEGAGLDADPLFRWDKVDCLTLVEETMALSLVAAADDVVETLNLIRYGQGVSYEVRNHLMEAQWIPSNLQKGFIEDVTHTFGGKSVRRISKSLSRDTWQGRIGRALKLRENPLGSFGVDIVPAAAVLDVARKAPAGLIVVVVRADRPAQVTRVSHVGILIQGRRGPMLRHASKSFRRVVDEPLEKFLRRNLAASAGSIEGLSFFRLARPMASAVDGGV
jgi:hypothetical protein